MFRALRTFLSGARNVLFFFPIRHLLIPLFPSLDGGLSSSFFPRTGGGCVLLYLGVTFFLLLFESPFSRESSAEQLPGRTDSSVVPSAALVSPTRVQPQLFSYPRTRQRDISFEICAEGKTFFLSWSHTGMVPLFKDLSPEHFRPSSQSTEEGPARVPLSEGCAGA